MERYALRASATAVVPQLFVETLTSITTNPIALTMIAADLYDHPECSWKPRPTSSFSVAIAPGGAANRDGSGAFLRVHGDGAGLRIHHAADGAQSVRRVRKLARRS